MYGAILLRLVSGLAGGFVAYKKGRDVLIWAVLCAFFPPLILALIFLRPRLAPGRTRKCPYCAGIVYHNDTNCRYCGRELPIELVRCGSCGNFVPDKKYCAECNRKLGD